MTNELVATNAALPAIFQGAAQEAYKEFSSGVTAGFPVISYRGKVWRVKKGGDEEVYLNADGEAVQSIDVVLVKSAANLAKIHYKKNYEEGDSSQPDCWSTGGISPDTSVPEPVAPLCAACPNNVWGSKITDTGKKARACSDTRRMAVAFMHEVEAKALDPALELSVLLLRVPPASLNPLKDYVEKTLQPKGVPPFALVTKVAFEVSAAYPKLTFKGVQFLNEEQGAIVMALREGDEVKRILSETEYTSGGTTDANQAAKAGAPAEAEVPTAPPEAPSPAAVEEMNTVDDIAPAAPPTPAPVVEEIAAAAPSKKADEKVKAAQPDAPAVAPADTVAGEGDDSFDSMLDDILG